MQVLSFLAWDSESEVVSDAFLNWAEYFCPLLSKYPKKFPE